MSSINNLTPHQIATAHLDKLESKLTLKRQCELLGISRASAYYEPAPVSLSDIDLMERIDKIHTASPTYGSRIMANMLSREVDYIVGRKRAGTLMENMGIEAVYPKPRLSFNGKPHVVFPYLLKDVLIIKPNHVWSADITYIKLNGSFLYLVVFIDWFTRYILSWKLSDSLKTDFCLDAANAALTINVPGIVNFDQGVQFTDEQMIAIWTNQETKISMDHKGRCFDNIFVERFWRTLKYEEVYLKDYTSPFEARASIAKYIDKYNFQRPHSSLGYKTPAEIYFAN